MISKKLLKNKITLTTTTLLVSSLLIGLAANTHTKDIGFVNVEKKEKSRAQRIRDASVSAYYKKCLRNPDRACA